MMPESWPAAVERQPRLPREEAAPFVNINFPGIGAARNFRVGQADLRVRDAAGENLFTSIAMPVANAVSRELRSLL